MGLSVVASGCLGGSGDQPGQAAQPASGPAWSLSLKTACPPSQGDQCAARHGFTVDATGHYQVGPGPSGQVRQGVVRESELAALSASLEAALPAQLSAESAEAHESGFTNEGNDTVTLVRQGREAVLARNTGGELYHRATSVEAATSLHKAIRDLAKSYYPRVFGNDCGDAAGKVEALYAAVQGCQNDIDCVYVDAGAGYAVVPPASGQSIFTDRCEAVQPLVVANKIAILDAAKNIQAAYASALETCGRAQFYSAGCAYQYGWTNQAPTCVNNRCQSNL